MDETSRSTPLLLGEEALSTINNKTYLFTTLSKLILKSIIWAIFLAWVTFILLLPWDFVNGLQKKWIKSTSGTLFGETGSVFLLFSGPLLIISFLTIAYLILYGNEEIHKKKDSNDPRFSLWTFPVVVDGPYGVVSAAELIGILLFYGYIIFGVSSVNNYLTLSWIVMPSANESVNNYLTLSWIVMPSANESMVKLAGRRFGYLGLMCLAFLFLPVARGSVLLRFVHIPFEQAIRYHIWLGHLTMALFTLHGVCYMIGWGMQGILLKELIEWKNVLSAHLPGVVGLISGLMMWITSMPGIRRSNFELFYFTHQLYVIFIVFLAMHVGDYVFSVAAAGIFIFMLDRFLRFCQSRRTVDVLSTRCFPCGAVELVLSKPVNIRYTALGWIFLRIRELSLLQWHPFSISSSPSHSQDRLSVLIKASGGWTHKLKDHVFNVSGEQSDVAQLLLQPHSKISAFVEGPYGHESPYHMTYENLVLVAGGVGISPFLAILSDMLHRINDCKPCRPKNVLIIWAVKKSDELQLLQTLDMESICPFFSNSINLEIQTYVTRESSPSLEEGKVHHTGYSSVFRDPKGNNSMSVLVGTGNIVWSGIYIITSTLGLIISVGLLNTLYVIPFGIHYTWYKGLLFVACMATSVIVFGGLVIVLWLLWERKTSLEKEPFNNSNTIGIAEESLSGKNQCITSVMYGQRPDFGEILGSLSERWGRVDIGVIVCGPYPLMSSVARECRTRTLRRQRNDPIFHFNSHSFEL